MNHGEHGEKQERKSELKDCDELLIDRVLTEDCLLLELKSVDMLSNIHIAQVMNYLKLLNFKRGYLLNFNVKLLKEGIKRVSI